MIIDFHTHIFPPQIRRDRDKYVSRDPAFAAMYSNPQAKMATADDLIASMDRDGVEISVVLNMTWSTHELCVETNDYILESIAQYPQRLAGFCSVLPRSGDDALKEVRRCVRGGALGIGEMRPDSDFLSLENKQMTMPFIQTLQENNLILLLHASEPVGHIYPGKENITPEKLYPFITRFPDLKIVCAHWGGGLPFYALMPEVKKAMNNVYFDTAASPFLYSPQIYNAAAGIAGPEKILMGSDYPLLPQNRLINEIRSADLEDRDKDLILSGNAKKLLGIR